MFTEFRSIDFASLIVITILALSCLIYFIANIAKDSKKGTSVTSLGLTAIFTSLIIQVFSSQSSVTLTVNGNDLHHVPEFIFWCIAPIGYVLVAFGIAIIRYEYQKKKAKSRGC